MNNDKCVPIVLFCTFSSSTVLACKTAKPVPMWTIINAYDDIINLFALFPILFLKPCLPFLLPNIQSGFPPPPKTFYDNVSPSAMKTDWKNSFNFSIISLSLRASVAPFSSHGCHCLSDVLGAQIIRCYVFWWIYILFCQSVFLGVGFSLCGTQASHHLPSSVVYKWKAGLIVSAFG